MLDMVKTKTKPAFDLDIDLVLNSKNATRSIRVGANITFERLHKIIQAAYCWHESHLYQFNLFEKGEESESVSVEIVTDINPVKKQDQKNHRI